MEEKINNEQEREKEEIEVENNEKIQVIDNSDSNYNSEETKDVSSEIETLTKELEDKEDRLKRLMAEFENFKKRSAKDRENLYGSLISDIISSLLPVIDNLEQAISIKSKDESYKEGIRLVLKQFLDVLNTLGVKQIEAVGNPFDPELHEAVSSVVDDTLGEKIIKEEYRKGYIYGTKVIRHAMVVVAN